MEAVTDLLEKRAANFVDRQRLTMLNEVVGLSKYLTLSKYNSLVKTQRAALKQPLSAPAIRQDYSKLLEEKSREYLRRCLTRPEDFLSELHNIVGEVIIRMTYGRLKDEAGTDYVRVSERLMSIVTAGLEGYAVDLIPALKYLPSWLPGMEFKRSGLRLRKEFVEFELEMLKSVTESLHSDDPEVRASFMYKKFEELHQAQDDTMDPQQAADEAMSLIRVGIQVFVAMSLFPVVQEKAQSEIDKVIGSQRLPIMEDMPNMPYMHAVVLETLRWNPTATFGNLSDVDEVLDTYYQINSAVPHVSREDEVYGGYYIPKGTAVIANAWGISQNPKYYSNPSEFNPDRHLQEPPELDPREYGFGYGRRICPGKELAFRQTWLMAVSIIWAFKLVSGEDDLEAWRARVDRYYFKVLK
ncbi:hypothetical protein FRB90_006017 [Tulasnella sp. 427]|nr:hypothetical protein FRB90_006017 [Tulasnella sp. 427]